MKYKIMSMTEEIARQIAAWKYDGEYAVYNTPPYEVLKEEQYAITNPHFKDNYLCFIDQNNQFVGYINLTPKIDQTIVIGIGLAPHACGRGLGYELLTLGVTIAQERYPNQLLTLYVRDWNRRAIKCYLRAGFKEVKTETIEAHNGEMMPFVFMTYIEANEQQVTN